MSDVERRKLDELQEKVVAEYLDKYFYSTWAKNIVRNTDFSTQIKGLDLTITSNNNNVYTIDEKAAVKWANRSLMTFAFEVDSLDKNGNIYDGWFLQGKEDTMLNKYWMFIWIDSASTDEFKKADDIEQVTVSFARKGDVYNWFVRHGMNSKTIKEEAKELREKYNRNNRYTYTYINKLKMTIQDKFREHSINILMNRATIENELSTFSATVRKNKITTIRRKVGI